MPKRTDIHSVFIVGSGPIIIGQGCEFDYAGTQACNVLRKENVRVILLNSNPATIMTDPEVANTTYIAPITEQSIEHILAKERPEAWLPTVGGQIALNHALQFSQKGILKHYNVELLGVSPHIIDTAEDRLKFKNKMIEMGIETPRSEIAYSLQEVLLKSEQLGYPVVMRHSFALGGKGSLIAFHPHEIKEAFKNEAFKSGSNEYPIISPIILDKALLGWKEYELEVIRDNQDNCIVVCGIENIHPLGVHTGDSITVSPMMTLTDKEYQSMRNEALRIIRSFGIVGGANVQFAVNPKNGERRLIEINPRLSRSSALASKATGYPIAKIATLLSIGFTLTELQSDIGGGKISAALEPVMDYVVVKMPRFQFEKFPDAKDILGTKMQSVGETMGVGRTFQEAMQKAIRSLEIGRLGFEPYTYDRNTVMDLLKKPNSNQIYAIADAIRLGIDLEIIHNDTGIDLWFLAQIQELVENELEMQRIGKWNIHPVFKRIDGCAAEFETSSHTFYSTFEEECEASPSQNKKFVILGSGPNRIGQGIEFDYSCVQAIQYLRYLGYETIVINNNPATVSTDFSIANRLYFSPLIAEDVLAILSNENPNGVFLQFGGQTPLNLVESLSIQHKLMGLSKRIVEKTENRSLFYDFLKTIGLTHPDSIYYNPNNTQFLSSFPLPAVIRPSYIIGGTKIQIIHDSQALMEYLKHTDSPLLIEQYLENAIEVEIDAVSDGQTVFIPAIVENIEPVGIHSGDSTCILPPLRISPEIQEILREYTKKIAIELHIIGIFNVQFAIQNGNVYILELNPRASRTLPFVSKACGVNLIQLSIDCILGKTLKSQKVKKPNGIFFAIKKPIFPEINSHPLHLGPEMKSIGEEMIFAFSLEEAQKICSIENKQVNKQKIISNNQSFVQKPLVSLQHLHRKIGETSYA